MSWLEDFRAEWLPDEVRNRVRTVIRRSGEVGIEVEGWVGSITLLNGDLLHIGSKFGETDFMRILFRAQGIADYASTSAEYGLSSSRSPLRYVVPVFLRSLKTIHSQGTMFGWHHPSVKSRTRPAYMNIAETVRRIYSGKKEPYAGRIQSRTVEIPEHRILSAAATFVMADEAADTLTEDDRLLLLRWRQRRPVSRTIYEDLHHVQAELMRGRYHGTRGYYAPALREALVILGFNGLTTLSRPEITADGFLTNSDMLFEKYIRSILLEAHSSESLTFVKEKPDTSYLFVDGTASLEPDILVRRGNHIISVGDIKHKSPASNDYYQMFTYLRQYKVQRGFLLCASDISAPTQKLLITQSDGNEIILVRLPINDLVDLEERVTKLSTIVGF